MLRRDPAAENTHHQGILDVSIAPARITPELARQAGELACGVATKLAYVGVLGVEMFVSGARLLLNEIAPRPHNSGHYTLDACVTNQFEQQVRALCGLPLGVPDLLRPAVMVNLLGDIWRAGEPAWQELLADSALKLHLYGKTEARPGRKMGHFTVLDATVEGSLKRALASRQAIGVDGAVVPA